jgi:hypothetical protein
MAHNNNHITIIPGSIPPFLDPFLVDRPMGNAPRFWPSSSEFRPFSSESNLKKQDILSKTEQNHQDSNKKLPRPSKYREKHMIINVLIIFGLIHSHGDFEGLLWLLVKNPLSGNGHSSRKKHVTFANSKNNFREGFQHNTHGFRN